MMSPDNIMAIPVSNDDQSSGGRQKASLRPPEQALKCPRCDSPNTKFCYYNNYSLTQPRHFCKTCRRYWTNGGALRNVPIGGGCRNDRKTKSGSRLISGDFKNTSASSETSGLKFFNGISPAMDFQLGGLPFSRLLSSTTGICNQFVSSGEISPITTKTTSGSLMGFKYPICSDLRE
ncbi:hypothetical protein HHK36_030786 [Tetracentron sinense]|uniref:Dof zinc finger protein n=1 Tax=Tetracentron sinense TaxID=13715 RepID=A0A834YDF2_TETSI|nr:hypothetical protein HHK36_030786 [Tetracentron sinense]